MHLNILAATKNQLPIIQNLARFYAYDLSKSCGFYELFDWSFPENGLYEGPDVTKYWQPDCYPYIVRVEDELAGFVLVNKIGNSIDIDWNMGEFFIVGKFQGKGIGQKVAFEIFNKFPGKWEVMQMPPNLPAIQFWKKVIAEYTRNQFTENTELFHAPEPHDGIVLRFTAKNQRST